MTGDILHQKGLRQQEGKVVEVLADEGTQHEPVGCQYAHNAMFRDTGRETVERQGAWFRLVYVRSPYTNGKGTPNCH